MVFFKKALLLILAGAVMLFCVSCGEADVVNQSSVPEEKTQLVPNPDIMRFENGSYIYSGNADTQEAVVKEAKRLLADYDLEFNQTLRFPYDGVVYQTIGDSTITSLAEAQAKCPDFSIPEKLGEFDFADLTVDTELVSVVYPDFLPLPNYEDVIVLTDDEPLERYLCYKNESIHFRIAIWPSAFAEELDGDRIIAHMSEWMSHPEVYVQYEDILDDEAEVNSPSFSSLLIPSQADGVYAFFIHKLSSDDCLESETLPITQDEAELIYQAISADFSK